jgi:hypothetical protein
MSAPRIVDFSVEKLGALRILLENGTTLDVQLVPIRITDTGQKHENGEPLYQVQFSQTMDQRPPEGRLALGNLKKDA